MEVVLKAARVAKEAHKNQVRKWLDQRGVLNPYIVHPARVAQMVVEYHNYFELESIRSRYTIEQCIAAAWLHDVVEDTAITYRLLYEMFPYPVCSLVNELTNITHNNDLCREERKKLDRQRISEISYPAKLIKIMDRIDNLRDMGGAPENFRWKYTQESKLLLKECFEGMPTELTKIMVVEIDRLDKLVGDFKVNTR